MWELLYMKKSVCTNFYSHASHLATLLLRILGYATRSHGCQSTRSKLLIILTAEVLSTSNFHPEGQFLNRHFVWCWKGLLMPWSTSEESCGEITHWFFTMTTCLHILTSKSQQFLTGKGIFDTDHVSYSPVLAPPDFRLFTKLKEYAEMRAFSRHWGHQISCEKRIWHCCLGSYKVVWIMAKALGTP
jgi:hypothetical protein